LVVALHCTACLEQINKNMTSEKEIRLEIRHSLREWGIRPDGNHNPDHKSFQRHVIETAVGFSHPDSEDVPQEVVAFPPRNELPDDLFQALEVFLTKELEESMERQRGTYSDKLNISWSHMAPCKGVGKLPDGNYRKYIIRSEFEKFNVSQLDPLRRFLFGEPPNPAAEQFFVDYNVEEGHLNGAFAEVLVTRHATYKVACYSCKRRGCLRWNGGSGEGSSWRDMVCIECGSCYEIKSKASLDHVVRSLTWGMYTGSFRSFHLVRKALEMRRGPQCKHYLVVVSRACSVGTGAKGSDDMSYPVKIAEIDTVVPRLSPKSFKYRGASSGDETTNKLTLKSFATVRQNTVAPWFRVPRLNGPWSDVSDVVENVFVSKFSKEKWDELNNTYDHDSDTSETGEHRREKNATLEKTSLGAEESSRKSKYEQSTTPDVETLTNSVEDIRKDLEGLKTTCSTVDADDWETAFDSD
jgi:hypothetical protein